MPFFLPALSIPCLFIFLIPLILKSKKTALTFFDGFVWGVPAFGVHGIWFLVMIATKQVGASAIVLWLVTIGWLSLFSGLWLKLIHCSWLISTWLLTTVLFFFFIDKFCMFPFGGLDGYPFFSPLIPLCYYPKFLWCVKYIGSVGVLSCLILFQICLTEFFYPSIHPTSPRLRRTLGTNDVKNNNYSLRAFVLIKRFSHVLNDVIRSTHTISQPLLLTIQPTHAFSNPSFVPSVPDQVGEVSRERKIYFLLALLCLIPFLVGSFFYQEKKIPTSHIKYLKPWWYGHHNPMFVGYRMVHDIGEVIMTCPQTAYILMPESTFCWDVLEYQKFVPLWCDPDCGATIMFGGHRCVDGRTFNSFIVLRGGKITYYYDKQHLMPFVERVPKICSIFGCGNFFINEEVDGCKCSVDCLDTIELCGQTYQVFICSELFFEAKKVKGYPIILIWNESWFCCKYMKDLAILYIKYFEIKHDVMVLYASTQGRTNVGKVNVE